jgi:hypothetical protein
VCSTQVLLDVQTRGLHPWLRQHPAESARNKGLYLAATRCAKKALQKLWGGVADLHGDRLLLPDEPCLEDGQGLVDGSGLGKYLDSELEGLEAAGMFFLCGL